MNFQTGSDYPIEIWEVSNPNFSPTIWMNFQTGSDYPIAIWWRSVKSQFSPTVWMNFQTGSDCLIAIWQSGKSQFFPDRLDEFQNRIWFPIAIWQASNRNVSTTGSDYPIAIWQNVKSQFFRDRFDEFPNRVWLPNCDLTKFQFPIFPRPFGWISRPGLITQLRFDKVSSLNFSPTVWINFQTGSAHPIAIWQSV